MSGHVISGEQALDSAREYGFVAPHSYSANVRAGSLGPEVYLSVMSKMAIDAACQVVLARPESQLVITGETCYGDELPTTTELLVERASDVFNIHRDAIRPLAREDGKGLNNTYLQTEALSNFFKQSPEQPALIVPLGYHLKRIVHTAQAYGIQADFVAAEDVLHAASINTYDRYLPLIAMLESSERLLRGANKIDRQGKIMNLIMKLKGPRQVDVIEIDGELVLEEGYSQDKLAQVLAAS